MLLKYKVFIANNFDAVNTRDYVHNLCDYQLKLEFYFNTKLKKRSFSYTPLRRTVIRKKPSFIILFASTTFLLNKDV